MILQPGRTPAGKSSFTVRNPDSHRDEALWITQLLFFWIDYTKMTGNLLKKLYFLYVARIKIRSRANGKKRNK